MPMACAVKVHSASATKRHAAAELGTRQTDFIAYHPQQRGVALRLDRNRFTVDIQICAHVRRYPLSVRLVNHR